MSDHIFTKYELNALSSESFVNFVKENKIDEFYITGADATACVKSTIYNMRKVGYCVNVISDCITSYDKRKIPLMFEYYAKNGAKIIDLKNMTECLNN